ncbi:MAG TPA: hypothetical protein VNO32_30425 [Candidatus Acidoferrum sp.]|nr:hypothetical protein [Candidatus Acidoferrum sp.]
MPNHAAAQMCRRAYRASGSANRKLSTHGFREVAVEINRTLMAISLRQGPHSVQEQVRLSEQIAVLAVFRSQYVENYHD